MVYYYKSLVIDPSDPVTIYMGKDKYENEELIKLAWTQDVWFHVDKYSSAHVYLRLPDSIKDIDSIPEDLIQDCAQLVKANSIEGNKKDNLTIIYTPISNIKKPSNDIKDIGTITFKNPLIVKKCFINTKLNQILNRLNKTKTEINDLSEIEELRNQNLKSINLKKKQLAIRKKNEEIELKNQRKKEKELRSYDDLLKKIENGQEGHGKDDDDDYDGEEKKKFEGFDSDEDFM